jgi:DNA mismatch endonuclease, patch repair protein
MRDPLSKAERSALMAKVRNQGNKSTEGVVERGLTSARICGWIKHPRTILGSPDFYFPQLRIAIFVDGCFWHSCPKCGRIPKSRVTFWVAKIADNRRRDNRVRRRLRSSGVHVLRLWEHELGKTDWLKRVDSMFKKIAVNSASSPSREAH